MPPDLRPISGLEAIWLAARAVAPPFVFHVGFAVPGGLEVDAVRDAVAAAAAAAPSARARLVGRLGRRRWRDGEQAPLVREVEAPGWDGEGPLEVFESAIDPRRAPPIEVLVVRGATDHLVFRGLHAAVDGRGLLGFAESVCAVAAGEPALALALAHPLDGALGPARLAAAVAPEPDRAAPLGPPTTSQVGATWRRLHLPGRPPGSPTAALAVALAHALGELRPEIGDGDPRWPLRVAVPVDLRRYTPADAPLAGGNCTGIVHLDLPADATLATTAATLSQAVEAGEPSAHARDALRVRGLPIWLLAGVGRRSAREAVAANRFPVSATISNLGRHALRWAGAPVDAFLVPPVSPGLPLFLGAMGGRRGVELCVAAPAAFADEATLDALKSGLARAWSALQEASAAGG